MSLPAENDHLCDTKSQLLAQVWKLPQLSMVFLEGGRRWGAHRRCCSFLTCSAVWTLLGVASRNPMAEARRLMKIYGRKILKLRKFSPTNLICSVIRKMSYIFFIFFKQGIVFLSVLLAYFLTLKMIGI